MKLLTYARIVGILLSAGTFAFLFINDNWRADNLFLVPDLILCAALVIAAVLPAPALAVAFGYSAGVLSCAVAADAVDGRFNAAGLFGALTAAVMAIVLAAKRP